LGSLGIFLAFPVEAKYPEPFPAGGVHMHNRAQLARVKIVIIYGDLMITIDIEIS